MTRRCSASAAKCKDRRSGLPLRQLSRDVALYKHRFPSLVNLREGSQKQIIRIKQRRIRSTRIKIFFLVLDTTALLDDHYVKGLVDIFDEMNTHVIWIMTQETIDHFERLKTHRDLRIKAQAEAALSWVQPLENMNIELTKEIQERYNRRDWAPLQTDVLLCPKTVHALVDGCKWYFEGNPIPYIHAEILRVSRTPISPFATDSIRMCNSLLSRRRSYTFTFIFGDRCSVNLAWVSWHGAKHPAQLIEENHGYNALYRTDNFPKHVDNWQTDWTASPRTGNSSQQAGYLQTDNSPQQAMDVDEFTTDVPMDVDEEGLEVAQPSFVIDSHLNGSVGGPGPVLGGGIVQVTGSMNAWVSAPGQFGNIQLMGIGFQSSFSVKF